VIRIVLGALLLELVLTVVSVPAFFFPERRAILETIIPPAAFLAAFPIGAWAARSSVYPVLAGAGVGIVSLVFYGLLVLLASQFAPPEQADTSGALSPAYLGAHFLKVAGGALGGLWVARTRPSQG